MAEGYRPPPDGERCSLNSGRGRCRKARVEGRSYCDTHLKKFERESKARMASHSSRNGAQGDGEERGKRENEDRESGGEGSSVTKRRIGVNKGEFSVSDSVDEIRRKRDGKNDTKKLERRKRKALQEKLRKTPGIQEMREKEEGSCRPRCRKPLKEREGKKRKRSGRSKDRSMHEKRARNASREEVVVQNGSDTESV